MLYADGKTPRRQTFSCSSYKNSISVTFLVLIMYFFEFLIFCQCLKAGFIKNNPAFFAALAANHNISLPVDIGIVKPYKLTKANS